MKAEESSIPAGKHFLPGTTAESMRAKHRDEEDPKAAERLLAYIMRKKGMSIRQICAALNRPYSTVRDWLVRAVTLSRKRFHSFGALVDGGFECRLCDRLNGDSFTGLPGHLRYRHRKTIDVHGNAGHHKSRKVRDSPGRVAATQCRHTFRHMPRS